jgi:sulfoxide reductase heme-binding subunit YedZ
MLAGIFLYLSLLPSPLYEVFPMLPGKVPFQRAKKALGISAFFFTLIYSSFIGYLFSEGVLGDLTRWNLRDIVGMVTLLGAFLILGVLAVTSIKAIKHRIRSWWKSLHRFVYLAGGLAAVHFALMIPSRAKPSLFCGISFFLIELLLLIQWIRFDRFLKPQYSGQTRVMVWALFLLLSAGLFWLFL